MNEEENVVTDNSNTEEVSPEETTTEEVVEESLEEVKSKLTKAEELAKNYKIRAEKAEGKKPEAKVEKEGLSNKDVLYLAKADINEADVDEVVTYAQKMNVGMKEAHDHYKPILAERNEERKTAQATQTKGGNRGAGKDTSEKILSDASKGDLPTDDAGIEKLAEARMAQKLAGR